MKELVVKSLTDNLESVLGFVDSELEDCGCSPKTMIQIDIAVEELFVNIAQYAYRSEQVRRRYVWNGPRIRAQ